jgi:hypothetical protein
LRDQAPRMRVESGDYLRVADKPGVIAWVARCRGKVL